MGHFGLKWGGNDFKQEQQKETRQFGRSDEGIEGVLLLDFSYHSFHAYDS